MDDASPAPPAYASLSCVSRLDVTPAELLAISGRLSAVADGLDTRVAGLGGAIAQTAAGLGGEGGARAVDTGLEATAAARRLVATYRGLAAILSTSAGRYVTVDGGDEPPRRGNPHWQG